MADIIPDSEFTPDQGAPSTPQVAAPTQPGPNNAPDFIPDSQFVSDEDKYGSLGQQAITGLEGAAEAGSFGLSTAAEKALGVKPEDIRLRREVNPVPHALGQGAGLVASSIIPGLGEGEALHELSAAAQMAKLGKAAAKLGPEGEGIVSAIAQGGLKNAAELGLFQGGDEVSKMLSEDPNQSLQTAAINIGLAGLIGGASGGALGAVSPLWKAGSETKVGQLISDFKTRVQEYLGVPEVAEEAVAAPAEPQVAAQPESPTAAPKRSGWDQFKDLPYDSKNKKFLTEEPEAIIPQEKPTIKKGSGYSDKPRPFWYKEQPTQKINPEIAEPVDSSTAIKPEVTPKKTGWEQFKNLPYDSEAKKFIAEPAATTPVEQAIPASSEEAPTKLSAGTKLADFMIKKGILKKLTAQGMAASAGAAFGRVLGLPPIISALVSEQAMTPLVESVLPSIIKPILQNIPSASSLKAVTEYGLDVIKGGYLASKAANAIFDPGKDVLPSSRVATQKDLDKLDKKIDDTNQHPGNLINVGGDLGHYMPSHQTAAGETVSNALQYLSSQKPKATKNGPLDVEIKPNKGQIAKYNRTLEIAQQPLTVMQHIKDGTLHSKDVQDLQAIYPHLYEGLKTKVYDSMISHVSKDGTIPYKSRMGLSLFLGEPLDSTLTPQSIMAAQATFLSPESSGSQPQAAKPKKSTAPLSKFSTIAETPAQARESDRRKA